MTPRALFERIAAEQDELRAGRETRERVRERLRGFEPPRRHGRTATRLALFAAALGAAALIVSFSFWRDRPALELRVGDAGAPALVGAWLGAPEDRRLPLEFSDGTRLELAPNAKARVLEIHPDGARLELASGALSANVVPSPASRYELMMGPFAVRVTGTRFDVSYRVESDRFELVLDEGQVELSGCVFGRGKKIAAGQVVRASCRAGTLSIAFRDNPSSVPVSSVAPARTAEPELRAPPATPEREPEPSATLTKPSPEPSAKPRPSWVTVARRGDHREAFALAKASGLAAECARASAPELQLLADAARHAGAAGETEQALHCLRRRFPGSPESVLAAFTLGRLAFDGRGAYREAAGWFESYLRERPGGPLTREALGRLVEAHHRAGDGASARAAASAYLAKYPAGPHAELAARLATAP